VSLHNLSAKRSISVIQLVGAFEAESSSDFRQSRCYFVVHGGQKSLANLDYLMGQGNKWATIQRDRLSRAFDVC